MLSLRTLLLATTTLSMLAAPVMAVAGTARPARAVTLAQSDEAADPAVAAAIQAVEQARADLRDAMAKGGDVRTARRTLNEALKQLNDARVAAGQPPLGKDAENAGDDTQKAPSPREPKAAEAPAGEQPAAASEEGTPAPKFTKKPPKPADAAEPPAGTGEPAKAEAQPTEKAPATATGTPDDQAPPRNFGKKPPKAVDAAEEPATTTAPADAGQPAAKQPPPAAATGPSPTEDANQPPSFGKKPPQFGRKPDRDQQPEQAQIPPPLPKSGTEIREGQQVEAEGGRTILREGGQLTIRHDDDSRFQGDGRVQVESAADGGSKTIVTRPNGVKIVTLRDRDGNILERYRQLPNGQVVMLIGNADAPPPVRDGGGKGFRPPPMARGGDYDFDRRLPPIRVPIPQDDYIVESRAASPDRIEEALAAPPIERVERPYTLDEIRRSDRLRAKLRRIDVDTVTFDFGQATVPDDQIGKLQVIGRALQRVIERDPSEVFLIEGHTDAVGSDLANLALSDRRAESVAEILTDYFDIPPENLVTQGYGEQYLKIPTELPERENRRVTLRRITPLLNARQ